MNRKNLLPTAPAPTASREAVRDASPKVKPLLKISANTGSINSRALMATVAALRKERDQPNQPKPARPRRALISFK